MGNVSVCLVSQTYVVYPQRVAHRTDVGTAVARIELEYHVSRDFASRSPTYFLDGNHFAFRVFGILRRFARGECPSRGVETLVRDVAIFNVERGIVFPIATLVEAVNHGTYALGIDVSLCIFPTLLQVKDAVGHVLSGHGFTLGNAVLADTVARYNVCLVVEHQGFGASAELYAGIEFGHWVLGVGDGLNGVAQKDGAGSKHFDVDDAKHFSFDNVRIEFYAVAVSRVRVFVDADVGFRNARHLGPHVRRTPRCTNVHEVDCFSTQQSALLDGLRGP